MKQGQYKVGDLIRGTDFYSFGGNHWINLYHVLEAKEENRFGKPSQLLTVKITTSDGYVVDEKTLRWAGQLF